MKDEIKEILDKLQKVANRETASRNALMEMKDTDYQLLLDNITNLEKERNMFKGAFETMTENYFEENKKIDKAIERAIHIQETFGYELSDLIFLLQRK